MDGRVRVWTFEPIDQADPPDDDRVVQVEPIYDFYTPDVQFMFIIKQSEDENNTLYYAQVDFQLSESFWKLLSVCFLFYVILLFLFQDGNGGLWRIDLNTETEVRPSEQLYQCHAGKVMDIAACPWGMYLASLGEDGRIQVYNYITRKLLFRHQFPAKGRAMIWLPIFVSACTDTCIKKIVDYILSFL